MRRNTPLEAVKVTLPVKAMRVARAVMDARRRAAQAGKGQPGQPPENYTASEYVRQRFEAGHAAFIAQSALEFLRRGRNLSDVAKLIEEDVDVVVSIASQNGLKLDGLTFLEDEGARHSAKTIRELEGRVAQLLGELATAKRQAGRATASTEGLTPADTPSVTQ
jgi:hypothetical protein